MTSSCCGVNSTSQANKNKYVKISPYDSMFCTSDEKDISVLIKNMENVLFDQDNNQEKIAKVCNFQVKVKK